MGINVRLVGTNDANGQSQEVDVGTRRFLQVAIRDGDPPPIGELSRLRFFSGLLGSTGVDSGTTNMNVDGTTPQEFFIAADDEFDIRITTIVVFIGDGSITHDQFGGLTALTNGWTLKVREAGVETAIINEAKTNADVLIQSATLTAWGDSATAFELSNYSGTQDALFTIIPMSTFIPGGLRIGRGTRDRLISRVSDVLTGLNDFTVRAIGYKHFP